MLMNNHMASMLGSKVTMGSLATPRASSLELVPGQILSGVVLRLLPNQAAIVRLHGLQIRARLETSVTIGEKNWFQVLPNRNPISLRLIPVKDNYSEKKEDYSPLLKWLGLKDGKAEEEIMRYFVRERLPIAEGSIERVQAILESLGKGEHVWQSIQAAVRKGWPLTESIVKAIYQFLQSSPPLVEERSSSKASSQEGTSINKDIQNIAPYLNKQDQQRLQQLLISPGQLENNKATILGQFFTWLGVSDVALLRRAPSLDVLQEHWSLKKALMLHLQQDASTPLHIREGMERVISYILGQQLFYSPNQETQQPVLQYYFQLLFDEQHLIQQAKVQVEGRKTKAGELDPDNCRLFFYLQLSSLGEISIQLTIANRIVSLTLYHEEAPIPFFQEYKPIIKKALEEIGYTLSVYQWKEASADQALAKAPSSSTSADYKGMDIRI